MANTKKRGSKKTIVLVGIIIILVIIGILISIKKNKEIERLKELETIAFDNFIDNVNMEYLIGTEAQSDMETAKVRCIIYKHIQNGDTNPYAATILKEYNNLFGENENTTVESIDGILTSENIQNFDTQFLPEEEQESIDRMNEINYNNTKSKAFKKVTKIEEIEKDTYEVTMDIVQELDKAATINYYIELQNASNNAYTEVNLEELNNFNDLENAKTLDLTKYLNNENYKKIAKEILSISIKVKVESGRMIIIDF